MHFQSNTSDVIHIFSSPLSSVNPYNTIEFDGITPRLNRYNHEQNYLTEPSCSERNQRHAREKVPFILLLCDKPDCSIFHRPFRFRLKAYENSCFKSSSSTSLFIAVNICILNDLGIECCLGHFIQRFVEKFFFVFQDGLCLNFGCYYFCNLLDKCGYNFSTPIAQIYLNCFINRI